MSIQDGSTNDPTDLIRDLLGKMKIDLLADQVALTMLQQAKPSVQAKFPNLGDAQTSELLLAFEREFLLEKNGLLDEIITAYSKVFSEQTVVETLNFYNSEVGKAFQRGSERMERRFEEIIGKWSSTATSSALDRAYSGLNKL
ncbi:MAG: DUF2059 domain-containing protein [Hyphomonadaceae bacterium]